MFNKNNTEQKNAEQPPQVTPVSKHLDPAFSNDISIVPDCLRLLKAPILSKAANKEKAKELEENPALSPDSVTLSSLRTLVGQSFKFHWERQKNSVIALSAVTAGTACATVASVFLSADLATSVAAQFKTGASLELGVTAFTMLTATYIVSSAFGIVRQGFLTRFNQDTQRKARDEITNHSQLLSVKETIGQKNSDNSQLILQNIYELARIPESSANVLTGVVQVGISAFMLSKNFPGAAALLVLSSVPTFLVSINRALERCKTNLDFLVTTRIGWRRDWLLANPQDTFTFRRLGEVEGLKELRNKVNDQIKSSQRRLDDREGVGSGIATAIQYGSILATGAVIYYSHMAASAALGDIMRDLGLVTAAGLGFVSVMRGTSDFARNLLTLKPFYDMVDENISLSQRTYAKTLPTQITEAPHIHIENLSYSVDGKEILKNINLDITPGEILGVCGPSGHGKSTLIKITQGIAEPTEGTVTLTIDEKKYGLDEISVDSWLVHITPVAQDDHLQDGFSLGDNLQLGNHDGKPNYAAANTVVKFSELLEHLKATTDSMLGDGWFGGIRPSGGEHQKLLLTRALSPNKKIMILDEPLRGIGITEAKEIQAQIISIARERKMTVIFITHGLADLRDADRIIVVEDGTIKQEGTPQDLLGQKGFYRDGSLSQLNSSLELLGEVESVEDTDEMYVVRVRKHGAKKPETKSQVEKPADAASPDPVAANSTK